MSPFTCVYLAYVVTDFIVDFPQSSFSKEINKVLNHVAGEDARSECH